MKKWKLQNEDAKIMLIKIGDKQVDVSAENCGEMKCFQLGRDYGTFVQGRGYTSVHKKSQWVCMTRHLHGCPNAGVCLDCKMICSPANTEKCEWCGSENIQLKEEKEKE